jgi:phage-related protein
MAAFRDDLGAGYRVESYGDGVWMITDAGRGQGRCFFFRRVEEPDGSETLVSLLYYKKETQRAPERILRTAKQRMQGKTQQ